MDTLQRDQRLEMRDGEDFVCPTCGCEITIKHHGDPEKMPNMRRSRAAVARPCRPSIPSTPAWAGCKGVEMSDRTDPERERPDQSRERQDNLRPEAENQAAAMPPPDDVIELGPPDDARAGESADTGAGTGGATDSDGRPRHNEGIHLGNLPNS